jgi:putative ABC transport system permease protein
MRLGDRLALAFGAIGRHRVRTLLTLLGIVIGTFALVISLAVGRGIDFAVVNIFRRDDQLRRVYVTSNAQPASEAISDEHLRIIGEMSESRRARLLKRRMSDYGRGVENSDARILDAGAIQRLGRLAHVVRATPNVRLYGEATLAGRAEHAALSSIDATRPIVAERLVAGRLLHPGERNAALAHEYLLYELGLDSEEAASDAVGRTIKFGMARRENDLLGTLVIAAWRRLRLSEEELKTLSRGLRRAMQVVRFVPMPKAEKELLDRVLSDSALSDKPAPDEQAEHEYKIVGIFRDVDPDEADRASIFDDAIRPAGLIVTPEAGAEFHDSLPRLKRAGYDAAQVVVDDESLVESVVAEIKGLGFETYSLAEFLGTVRMNVLLVSTATAFIAVIALVVAAIGIANTMIMSVLERTREIGIMKALGARDGQISGIFLLEGAVLGLAGGLLGLGLGRLAHLPGDQIAQSIIQRQVDTPIRDSLFAYPPWLVVGAPLLAATIATLAALYPAMRAARVDPVTSLRHD